MFASNRLPAPLVSGARRGGEPPFEVMGIGQDTPLAWSDAASRVYSREWVDAKEMIARHPEMKTVKAMVTVSFENPEVAG